MYKTHREILVDFNVVNCSNCNCKPVITDEFDEYSRDHYIECLNCHKEFHPRTFCNNLNDLINAWNEDQISPIHETNNNCCNICKNLKNGTCYKINFNDNDKFHLICSKFEKGIK